jgi:hypothetical protein
LEKRRCWRQHTPEGRFEEEEEDEEVVLPVVLVDDGDGDGDGDGDDVEGPVDRAQTCCELDASSCCCATPRQQREEQKKNKSISPKISISLRQNSLIYFTDMLKDIWIKSLHFFTSPTSALFVLSLLLGIAVFEFFLCPSKRSFSRLVKLGLITN